MMRVLRDRSPKSGVEQEMQDVAILDLIGLALDAELARLLGPGLAIARDVIVIGDGFGPDEALFKVTWMTPAACGARVPLLIVQARASFGPTVK